MRLRPYILISAVVLLFWALTANAVCIEEMWMPEDFDIEIETLGPCQCCYGQFCREGTLIMFWEPHRVIETVKDPYCSPTASTQVQGDSGGGGIIDKIKMGGTHSGHANTEDATVFAQVHYLTHPVLSQIISEFDEMCWEMSDPGIDYISEDDGDWQAIYSSDWWPEAGLFANLGAVEACMADAVASQLGFPLDALYWCMGAWGTLFNMNGHMNQDEYVTGNAGLAARIVAHMARRGFLLDAATVPCYAGGMPIWIKSYFKLQPIRPKERELKIPIGLAAELWSPGLNSPEKGDNFAWLLWRKRICCASQ